ncbi:MAG: hypothetical protein JRD84_06140 [Deltaproteobacteria bacterium]|nr:hypothetical protein [Deltaproteobacteria bacterium]
MNQNYANARVISQPLRWIYLTTTFFLVLTGFGQMPIFKRYYIADIPGLGWLAEFFVTHYIHYLGAIVLLALIAYIAADYLILKRNARRMTASGYIRLVLLTGILVSGGLLVIRNLTGTNFSPEFIIFLDIIHLGLVVVFLFVSIYCLIVKKHWTTQR